MGIGKHAALLCAGTRDGLFLFESDRDRVAWDRRGPYLTGCDVSALAVDAQRRIFAGTKQHGLFRSDDGGESWRELPLDRLGPELHAYYQYLPAFFAGNAPGTTESSIWEIQTVADDPNRLYVGVMPAALFTSPDAGENWSEVRGLRDLPQMKELWGPFGAGFLHSIDVVHNGTNGASNPALAVAISVGGVFRSYDGGTTWDVSNKGMTPWKPVDAKYDDVHQDIHRMVVAPSNRRRVYCTVHEPSILRSDDGGGSWETISLTGEEGATRPIAIHPRNADRLWIAPLDDQRPDGIPSIGDRLRVLESRDAGQSFADWSDGLGDGKCLVYRHAMIADEAPRAAVYLGTSQGLLVQRFEDGERWITVADDIPSVRALKYWSPLA
jgi:photosystem II stability/assembly factor-like uncharacterized protein